MAMDLVGPEDIVLAAPTGKAAARLQEAVNQARAAFPDLFDTLAMPKTARTLHRLPETGFRHPVFSPTTPKTPYLKSWSSWTRPPWWIWPSCPSWWMPLMKTDA